METSLQEITFQVPADYQVPQLFSELTPQETGHVLSLGASAFTMIQHESNKADHEALYLSLKQEAEKAFQTQVERLQKQLQQQTETLTSIKQRLLEEEASRLSTEKRVREEERRNREELLQEKDVRIESLQSQLQRSFQQVTDGFTAFKEQLLKTSTGSQTKGKQGEAALAEYITRVFGSTTINEEFTLEDVGKEGHQGDLKMIWRNHKILWESKNYSRNVDQKEVNKFLRDMEENKDMSLGIMISLQTGITGHQKAGQTDVQLLRDGRYCVYINNFLKQDDPILFLQTLKPFLEILLENNKKQTTETDEETQAQHQLHQFEQQKTLLLRLLQNHQESMRKFKNAIVNAKKKSDQIWVELTTEMREAEHQVKLLLETVIDSTLITDESSREEIDSISLPSYIFCNTELSFYTERERKFVLDTCTTFEFSEEYSISSKQVKELYKELGYGEEAVNSMRSRIFVEDVWEKGKKEVKYMRRKE